MVYDYPTDQNVQKYIYQGSYATWRALRWDKSYLDDMLKPYQAIKLTKRQREMLAKIDRRARTQGREAQR